MSFLKGSKILFICVKFFNYEIEILKKLVELGCNVAYYDERPDNSFLSKSILRLSKSLLSKSIYKYYFNILKSDHALDLNYFFLIKGEIVPTWFVEKLREKNSKAKFIFYNWDSIKNNANAKELLNYFDFCYSFDFTDAQRFKTLFYPLFFLNKFKNLPSRITEYDIIFIGTIHSDRLQLVEKIFKEFENKNLKSYHHYYLPSKLLVLKLFWNLNIKNIRVLKKINFTNLTSDAILNLWSRSKIILDIQHKNQTGLTIRTIEALGARKKIITTNVNIKKYHFFSEKNILVIDRKKPKIELDFINDEFSLEHNLELEKLEIGEWLSAIFRGKNFQLYRS